MIRKSGNRFSSRQTRDAFARRSCSNKNMDDEHDSTQLKHALDERLVEYPGRLALRSTKSPGPWPLQRWHPCLSPKPARSGRRDHSKKAARRLLAALLFLNDRGVRF